MLPFSCILDDKPVVVVTHGDLLSLSDRLRIRVHLGELLGIPPAKQIFDIPGDFIKLLFDCLHILGPIQLPFITR